MATRPSRWAALIPLVVAVVVGGLGLLVGLGPASVLAGLTGLFTFIAAVGGTLRADLRVLSWFGPTTIVLVGGIRVLQEWQPVAGAALAVLAVVAAGLLPVLGSRYITVGMGLGLAAVFAYGLKAIGSLSSAAAFGAPALAVAVVVLLRLLIGRKDPDQPLRAALAAALTDLTGPAWATAATALWADRPRRWTAAALAGTFRYRNTAARLGSRQTHVGQLEAAFIDQELAAAATEAERISLAVLDPGRRPWPTPGASRELRRS